MSVEYRRYLLWAILLALGARFAYFAYNLIFFDLPPYWNAMARAALDFVQGRADNMVLTEDRGIIAVYWILERITPPATHAKVRVLQIICDSTMVLAAAAIGRRIGGEAGGIVAAFTYALFPPGIYHANYPGYESWFAMSLLLATLLVIRVTEAPVRGLPLAVAALAVLLAVAAQFRSISVLFGVAAGMWIPLAAILSDRRWPRRAHWARAGACLLAGFVALGSSVAVNSFIRGDASPVRGTLGHSFWAGVGQYPNPFGVKSDDGSVAAFYERERGVKAPSYPAESIAEYDAWLVQRALRFIREQPGLYASMTARRAASILIPNLPVNLVADSPAFSGTQHEIERLNARRTLIADPGIFSPRFWVEMAAIDPGWIFGVAVRGTLMILLPFGYVLTLALGQRGIAILALLPVAYVTVILSPYYVTHAVVVGPHTASLPVAAAGFALLWKRPARNKSVKPGIRS
jgi:hypothetical protein